MKTKQEKIEHRRKIAEEYANFCMQSFNMHFKTKSRLVAQDLAVKSTLSFIEAQISKEPQHRTLYMSCIPFIKNELKKLPVPQSLINLF